MIFNQLSVMHDVPRIVVLYVTSPYRDFTEHEFLEYRLNAVKPSFTDQETFGMHVMYLFTLYLRIFPFGFDKFGVYSLKGIGLHFLKFHKIP